MGNRVVTNVMSPRAIKGTSLATHRTGQDEVFVLVDIPLS